MGSRKRSLNDVLESGVEFDQITMMVAKVQQSITGLVERLDALDKVRREIRIQRRKGNKAAVEQLERALVTMESYMSDDAFLVADRGEVLDSLVELGQERAGG